MVTSEYSSRYRIPSSAMLSAMRTRARAVVVSTIKVRYTCGVNPVDDTVRPKLGSSLTSIRELAAVLSDNIERVIVGKRSVVELCLVALLCEGHVLLEDVPGV